MARQTAPASRQPDRQTLALQELCDLAQFPSALPGYLGVFLILFDVQGSLLVFSRCSVKIVPFVDVFLMTCEEMNSPPSCSSAVLRISCQLL